jgi:hypothetical protein
MMDLLVLVLAVVALFAVSCMVFTRFKLHPGAN